MIALLRKVPIGFVSIAFILVWACGLGIYFIAEPTFLQATGLLIAVAGAFGEAKANIERHKDSPDISPSLNLTKTQQLLGLWCFFLPILVVLKFALNALRFEQILIPISTQLIGITVAVLTSKDA